MYVNDGQYQHNPCFLLINAYFFLQMPLEKIAAY